MTKIFLKDRKKIFHRQNSGTAGIGTDYNCCECEPSPPPGCELYNCSGISGLSEVALIEPFDGAVGELLAPWVVDGGFGSYLPWYDGSSNAVSRAKADWANPNIRFCQGKTAEIAIAAPGITKLFASGTFSLENLVDPAVGVLFDNTVQYTNSFSINTPLGDLQQLISFYPVMIEIATDTYEMRMGLSLWNQSFPPYNVDYVLDPAAFSTLFTFQYSEISIPFWNGLGWETEYHRCIKVEGYGGPYEAENNEDRNINGWLPRTVFPPQFIKVSTSIGYPGQIQTDITDGYLGDFCLGGYWDNTIPDPLPPSGPLIMSAGKGPGSDFKELFLSAGYRWCKRIDYFCREMDARGYDLVKDQLPYFIKAIEYSQEIRGAKFENPSIKELFSKIFPDFSQ